MFNFRGGCHHTARNLYGRRKGIALTSRREEVGKTSPIGGEVNG